MSTKNDLPKFPIPRSKNSTEPPEDLLTIQREDPFTTVQLFDATPAWLATKHKDICELLASKSLSNERYSRKGYPEIHPSGKKATNEKPTFVHLDDPDHARQRAMLEDLFTKEKVLAMKPQIQKVVDDTLDAVIKKGCAYGPLDLVEELATPIPTTIIYGLLGVPPEDIGELSKASAVRVGTSGTASESGDKYLHEYMANLVNKRIEKPGNPNNDVISKLVVEQYARDNIERDDIRRLAYLVLVAGNAAVINSIALGVLTLLQHPDQVNALKENPGLASSAVEEILRYHTPSALNSRRVAKHDLTIHGKEIKAGEGVIAAVQSGNRDGDVFPNPHQFDIRRSVDPEKNLAFGYGTHRCQAQWLSRVELEVVFASLFQRLPNLRLAVQPSELEYTPPTQNVGIAHLPVYF